MPTTEGEQAFPVSALCVSYKLWVALLSALNRLGTARINFPTVEVALQLATLMTKHALFALPAVLLGYLATQHQEQQQQLLQRQQTGHPLAPPPLPEQQSEQQASSTARSCAGQCGLSRPQRAGTSTRLTWLPLLYIAVCDERTQYSAMINYSLRDLSGAIIVALLYFLTDILFVCSCILGCA